MQVPTSTILPAGQPATCTDLEAGPEARERADIDLEKKSKNSRCVQMINNQSD